MRHEGPRGRAGRHDGLWALRQGKDQGSLIGKHTGISAFMILQKGGDQGEAIKG